MSELWSLPYVHCPCMLHCLGGGVLVRAAGCVFLWRLICATTHLPLRISLHHLQNDVAADGVTDQDQAGFSGNVIPEESQLMFDLPVQTEHVVLRRRGAVCNRNRDVRTPEAAPLSCEQSRAYLRSCPWRPEERSGRRGLRPTPGAGSHTCCGASA